MALNIPSVSIWWHWRALQ